MGGILSIFAFIRIVLGLITTKTFGPIISTIIFMFNDIAIFIVIWIIVLVMFGTIGALTFNETP